MINLEKQTIELPFVKEPMSISFWQTWYCTPVGLVNSIDKAVHETRQALGSDINVNMYIFPVPVAVAFDTATNQNYYEAFKR